MNRQVNVSSIAALRRFQMALRDYAETAAEVIAGLQIESRRTVDWVQHDRMAYWPHQVRQAGESLVEMRNRLSMKQLTLDGRDAPACTEEKAAVHRARQRLRYAERQLATTRRLSPIIQHESDEYRGVLAKLSQFIESDLPKGVAALERMAASLDKYAAVNQPESSLDPSPRDSKR